MFWLRTRGSAEAHRNQLDHEPSAATFVAIRGVGNQLLKGFADVVSPRISQINATSQHIRIMVTCDHPSKAMRCSIELAHIGGHFVRPDQNVQ
jgi:hypothetical protein